MKTEDIPFTPIRHEIRSDGRIVHYSSAYEAMKKLENAHHTLTHLEDQFRELHLTVAQARESYQSALRNLERELCDLYGDALPEAFEMPFGVLAMDDPEHGARLLTRRSWADTYRFEDQVEVQP